MTKHRVESKSFSLICLIGIGIVVVIAIVLRFEIAQSDPFWLDELHTGWVVSDGAGEVWTRAAEGNQTPLYFWLTYLSGCLFGMTELGLRAVSLVSGIGVMVTSIWILRRWTESWIAGALTVSLMAISDPFLYYQTEARPYALLQWLSLLQVISFLTCLLSASVANGENEPHPSSQDAWRASLAFVLTSLAMAYTHLTGILIAIPEVIFGFLYLGKIKFLNAGQIRWSRLLLPVGWVALGCLPLLSGANTVVSRTDNWAQVASLDRLVDQNWRHWLVWVLLPTVMLIGRQFVKTTPNSISPESQTATGNQVAANNSLHASTMSTSARTWMVVVWALTIPIAIGLINWFEWAPLALERYLAVGLVAGPLLSGLLVGSLPTLSSRYAVAILLLASSLGMQYDANHWWVRSARQGVRLPLRTETWRESLQVISSDEQRQAYPVLLFGGVIEDEAALRQREKRFQDYLQFPVRSIYPLDNGDRSAGERFVFAGPTINQVHFDQPEIEQVKETGGAWLLIRHRDEMVQEIVEELLKKTGSDWKQANLFASPDSLLVLVVLDIPPE